MIVDKIETLYLRLLLMHGGDPEPQERAATDIYHYWQWEVAATLKVLGEPAQVHRGYVRWLQERGLAYVDEKRKR